MSKFGTRRDIKETWGYYPEEAWVNDERVFRDSPFYAHDANYDDTKITKWWFNTYWGGESSPANNKAYFDEMQISDEPINLNI